jgi:hypothetical protein
MKDIPSLKWLIVRLLIVVLNVIALVSIPSERSNIDWPACFLIAGISAGGLFLWLAAIRYQQGVDWSEPYSWRKPFLPMKKYPLRYWFLVSVALSIAGAASLSRTAALHQGHEAVPGTFISMGLLMMLVVKAYIPCRTSGR